MNICTTVLCALAFARTVNAYQDADEGPRQLKGDYRVVINQTCIRTPFTPPPANGFDPNTKQLLVDGEALTALGHGLFRFEDDGTFQLLEGIQTEVSMSQIASGRTPVTPPAEFTCTGNYTLQSRKMTMTLSCDVKVTDPGLKVTVGPQQFEGYVDRDNKTINLMNLAGGLQAVTVSVFGNTVQQRQRICTQHAIATR
jgi:hypothetical protein